MKTALLTAAALLLGAAAIAQPTLTSATSNPAPGLTYQIYSNNAFNAGSAGAAQTWDFSSQTFTGPATYSYVGCSAPGTNCGSFPGSNLVQNSGGPQAYYISSSTALALNGFASNTPSGDLIYTDAEDVLHYPFTFNNTFVDPFSVTIVNSGVTFYRMGVDTVTADGWGVLKTPAGTYNNTLRIKQVSTYRDSANFMGTVFAITYRATIYTWRDATHPDFLYSTSTLTSMSSQTGTNTTTNSLYTANQNVGVTETTDPLSFRVYPNPAHGTVSFRLSLTEAASVEAHLTDLAGRVVKTLPVQQLSAGDHQLQLPAGDLSSGMYLLQLSAGGKRVAQRVMLAD